MSNSMSHTLPFNIPIRLQCFRVPALWRSDKGPDGGNRYYCEVSGSLLHGAFEEEKTLTVKRFDPWRARLQFLDVDLSDPVLLLQFLNEIGLYAAAPLRVTDDTKVLTIDAEDGRHVISHDPAHVWTEEGFRYDQDFCRDWPCHLVEPSEASFEARIAPTNRAPALYITTTNFYDAYQAAFAIDQIRRARCSKCKKPSCGKTFPFVGGRKRMYCSPECGHYMAVVKLRERQNAASKKRTRRHKD